MYLVNINVGCFVCMLTCRWEKYYQEVKEERKICEHPWHLAGLERSKYETGPTSTGNVSLRSCMSGKKRRSAGIIFHKIN